MTAILDVAPGLWLWRVERPDWGGDPDEWEPTVTCTCVESRGEVVLLDPHEGGRDAPPDTRHFSWRVAARSTRSGRSPR